MRKTERENLEEFETILSKEKSPADAQVTLSAVSRNLDSRGTLLKESKKSSMNTVE